MTEQVRPPRGNRMPSVTANAMADELPEPEGASTPVAAAPSTELDGGAAAPVPEGQEPREYEVGYGRPPRASRFKKGECGNPKGRPKGAKCMRALARQELDVKVVVRENGKAHRLTKRQIAVKRQVNKALDGDHRAFRVVAEMDGGTPLATPRAANDDWPPGSPDEIEREDRAILADYVAKILEARAMEAAVVPEPDVPDSPPARVREQLR